MMPTLETGDMILVNKYQYGLRLPVLNTKILPIGNPSAEMWWCSVIRPMKISITSNA